MRGVNHVGERSGQRQQSAERCTRSDVPLKLERDRIHDVDVQCDQQTSGALVPAEMKRQPSYCVC